MVTAEISLYPVGTDSTSLSFYIAKSIESISDVVGVKHQTTPMGTILESESMEKIFEASKIMTETIHRLGVKRIEIILKIDSRTDKKQTAQDKMKSLDRHLKSA
ncbi:MAG: MTH1187 family thiamine-binding protein [Candidatus Nitrosotenuis sp.]